jgi:hypothetical protein
MPDGPPGRICDSGGMRSLVGRLETSTDALLRSRGARWGGLVVGLAAVAFLGRSLADAGDEALAWFAGLSAAQVLAAAAGFALYHCAAVLTLRPIFGGPALRVWGAAQLIKYLPIPGSAVLGMVGTTVRDGGTTRHGVAVTVRHSLLQVGGATLVGIPAVAATAERILGIPPLLVWLVGVPGGLAVAWAGVKHLRRAPALACLVGIVAGWWLLGVLLAVGVARGEGSVLLVGAGFAAAWVVGQLALPVPAGIGVREAALLLLLGPVLGEVGALSFALGTRLVHVASDGVVAVLVLGRGGVRTLLAGRAGA